MPKKTSLPDTSLDANRRATHEMRSTHWGQIMLVMRTAGVPLSMEKIAEALKWEVNRVSRRAKEMENLNLIRKEGKSTTRSGRSCYNYILVRQQDEPKKVEDKEMSEKISAMTTQQFLTAWQNGELEPPQPNTYIQGQLL